MANKKKEKKRSQKEQHLTTGVEEYRLPVNFNNDPNIHHIQSNTTKNQALLNSGVQKKQTFKFDF